MRNNMFRTCVFGGYNKEDVDEYVAMLESELEDLRVGAKQSAQKEPQPESKESQVRSADSGDDVIVLGESSPKTQKPAQETAPASVVSAATEKEIARLLMLNGKLEEELAAAKRELERKSQEQEKRAETVTTSETKVTRLSVLNTSLREELSTVKEQLRLTESKLSTAQQTLQQREIELAQKNQQIQELEIKLQSSDRQSLQNELRMKNALDEKDKLNQEIARLRSEIETLQAERQNYQDDYKAVKNVLLNARVDAEIIVAKAQEKSKLIMQNTQRQIAQKRQESVEELVKRLSENSSVLRRTQFYLEEQAKSMEEVQKKIQMIQDNMETILTDELQSGLNLDLDAEQEEKASEQEPLNMKQ